MTDPWNLSDLPVGQHTFRVYDPDVRCICGPDWTGEAPDERPDCPMHGLTAQAPDRCPGPPCDCEAPF